jgi:TolB protein
VRRDGSGLRIIRSNVSHPSWSPDGSRVAFLGQHGFYVADVNGRHLRIVLRASCASGADDAWSPDGSLLAITVFSGSGPSQLALVPMGGNGRQPARVITDHPGGASDPAWSPDGKWLAYAVRDGTSVDLYVMQADGSAPRRLVNTGMVRAPAWSPDGRHLAYLSLQGSAFELWVLDVEETSAGDLEARNPRPLTRDLALDASSGVSWGPAERSASR